MWYPWFYFNPIIIKTVSLTKNQSNRGAPLTQALSDVPQEFWNFNWDSGVSPLNSCAMPESAVLVLPWAWKNQRLLRTRMKRWTKNQAGREDSWVSWWAVRRLSCACLSLSSVRRCIVGMCVLTQENYNQVPFQQQSIPVTLVERRAQMSKDESLGKLLGFWSGHEWESLSQKVAENEIMDVKVLYIALYSCGQLMLFVNPITAVSK